MSAHTRLELVRMRSSIRISGLAATGVAAVLAAAMSACAPDTSAPAFQPRIETLAPAVVAEPLTLANAPVRPTQVVFEDFACLDCHTDQQLLTELALPVENDHESLSSGPG